MNLHESLRQQFTKSKEENEEKLNKYEDSKNVKNSQNFQNLQNKYIDNLKEYIKSRIFMKNQEEQLIKYVKNEIEKIDKNIQEVEMKIKKIQNA